MLNNRISEMNLRLREDQLGQQLEDGSITHSEFTTAFQLLREDWINHRVQNSLSIHQDQANARTQECLNLNGSLFYDRVIIGAGTTATMVFDKLEEKARFNTLVLNDQSNPSTWLKGGATRLMTQPESLQTPGFLEPSSFVIDEGNENKVNPYHYTRMQHFSLAQMEKQNLLNMYIVNLKAGNIESQENHNANEAWEDLNYPYRIPLYKNTFEKYVYAKHIDICLGLGTETQLSKEQISPEVEKQLLENKTLIYNPQDIEQLQDGVVFYGNSAGCGTMVAELQEKNKHGVSVDIGGWYTRSKGDFDAGKMLSNLNRLVSSTIDQEKTKENHGVLRDGYILLKVDSSEDNNLKLIFQITGSDRTIEVFCPQLVVAIAQNPFNLVSSISKEMQFEAIVKNDIPLAVASKDENIIVWGAAFSTKSSLACYIHDNKKIENIFQLITDHVNTLPHESQVQPGLFSNYKKIDEYTKHLSRTQKFPLRKEENREKYFRQINAASQEELVEIFNQHSSIHYSQDQLIIYAKKIISERSTMQISTPNKTSGIHSADHLCSLQKDIPLALLNALRSYYFPHAAEFKADQETYNLSKWGIFAFSAIAITSAIAYAHKRFSL